jgi:hypothetical protein
VGRHRFDHMNINYQHKIAGQAFAARKNWEQVDGIAGTEINGWVLFHSQEGQWTREKSSTVFADADVKKCLKEPAKFATELKKAKVELDKAKANAASASEKHRNAQNSLDKALEPFWEMLTKGNSEPSQHLKKQILQDWAMNYKEEGIPPRVLLSSDGDWALIYFGTGFFSQYLITWDINAFFVSPLRERTVFNLEDLVAFFLSLLSEQEKPTFSNNTQEGKDQNEGQNTMKRKLLDMLSELIQRFRIVTPGKSGEHEKIELRPSEPDALNFLAVLLKEIDGHDGPITPALVAKLDGHEDKLEKEAKIWETGDIFKLWRVLPKGKSPDKAREALARVLAERITKSGDGRDTVLTFLAGYQALMDQNGMDKTAPHPLYYMILSRKSRGAISTLIDACEDDTLLDCTDWTVDKGAYEPRVWQTLLDGLTDRLTLKFHRDIYDADGFAQTRRMAENLKEMIEASKPAGDFKLPEEMREAYRWRLVGLVREALCRAEAAAKDQATETGGAAPFIMWVNTDFVQSSFVQENPQMKTMFTSAKANEEG